MRQHPYRGYEMVKKIPFLAEAAEIVYAHHEDFDGTGYPRGLKGEQIPLGARIVAVANTLESITSDLPYRKAESLTTAKERIHRCNGSAIRSNHSSHISGYAGQHVGRLAERD